MLLFSLYGTTVPAQVRCGLPGSVGCPNGIFGAAATPASAGEQFFTVTMYDWGFWIVDSTTGANETNAWNVFEGWTVHINATSLPPNAAIGGTAYHGLGVELNATGQQLLSLAAPVGQWVTGIFVAPTSSYHHQHIWCTISCGPGHGNQQAWVLNVIPPAPLPKAQVSANVTLGPAPLAVAFASNVSSGTPPYNLSWSFGDGAGGAYGPSAAHTYILGGTYYAVLVVTDSKGYQARASVTVSVLSGAPLSATLSATPSAGVAPLSVALSTIAHGGQPPYSYVWSYGTPANVTGSNGTVHLFAAPGIYAVEVTVQDSAGALTRALASITVERPSGSFPVSVAAPSTSGPAPFQPLLNATASGGSAPYTFSWFLGDGSTATGPSISPLYNTTGAYEATVFVTDSAGRVGIATVPIVATTPSTGGGGGDDGGGDTVPAARPAAAGSLGVVLTAFPSAGGAPLSINATASVIGGTATNETVLWNFGDGSTGAGQLVSHRFTSVGSYTVRVNATDSGANSGANLTEVNVVGLTLSVVINRSGCDAPCTLSAGATVLGGAGQYPSLTWSYGDGATGSGALVEHLYTNGSLGPMTLSATATDAAGASVSASTTVVVHPLPSVTITAVRAGPGGPPVLVNFSAAWTGGSGSYSPQLLWDFGDHSTTRGGANLSHTYNSTGDFLVSALGNDSAGAFGTGSVWVNITSAANRGPPVGGGGGGGSPVWVFQGVSNPDEAALVMMGIIAVTGLAMLVRRRTRGSRTKTTTAPSLTSSTSRTPPVPPKSGGPR